MKNRYVEVDPDTLEERFRHYTIDPITEAPNGLLLLGLPDFCDVFSKNSGSVSSSEIVLAAIEINAKPIKTSFGDFNYSESRVEILRSYLGCKKSILWPDINGVCVNIRPEKISEFIDEIERLRSSRVGFTAEKMQHFLKNGAFPDDIAAWIGGDF